MKKKLRYIDFLIYEENEDDLISLAYNEREHRLKKWDNLKMKTTMKTSNLPNQTCKVKQTKTKPQNQSCKIEFKTTYNKILFSSDRLRFFCLTPAEVIFLFCSLIKGEGSSPQFSNP